MHFYVPFLLILEEPYNFSLSPPKWFLLQAGDDFIETYCLGSQDRPDFYPGGKTGIEELFKQAHVGMIGN